MQLPKKGIEIPEEFFDGFTRIKEDDVVLFKEQENIEHMDMTRDEYNKMMNKDEEE